MHHFLYCITYLNVSQWHIGVQKVKNINIVKQKYLSEMNLIVWETFQFGHLNKKVTSWILKKAHVI